MLADGRVNGALVRKLDIQSPNSRDEEAEIRPPDAATVHAAFSSLSSVVKMRYESVIFDGKSAENRIPDGLCRFLRSAMVVSSTI